MKMIFKYPGRCSRVTAHWEFFVILSLLTLPIYADVTVNKLENNDKIINQGSALQNEVYRQESSEQSTTIPDSAIVKSETWELNAEQWELARSGESIMSLPVLNNLINAWLLDKHKRIEIQYPGGEEGEFWVHELSDWLVSLGIPSDRMVIIPGSGADDMIKFDLMK
jgi:hypothetical protein